MAQLNSLLLRRVCDRNRHLDFFFVHASFGTPHTCIVYTFLKALIHLVFCSFFVSLGKNIFTLVLASPWMFPHPRNPQSSHDNILHTWSQHTSLPWFFTCISAQIFQQREHHLLPHLFQPACLFASLLSEICFCSQCHICLLCFRSVHLGPLNHQVPASLNDHFNLSLGQTPPAGIVVPVTSSS